MKSTSFFLSNELYSTFRGQKLMNVNVLKVHIWHFFLRSFFGHFLTSGGFIPANIMFRPVKIDLERDMVSIEKNLNFFFVAHMWHNIWPAKWNSRFFAKFWCFGKFSLCAWCVRINMRKCWQKLLQYVYFSWQYGYAFIFCDNLYPEL